MSATTKEEMTEQIKRELHKFWKSCKQRFSTPLYRQRKLHNQTASAPESQELKDDSSDDVYNFNHPYRGLALIINNEFSADVKRWREGTEHDEKALEKSFKALGFDVEIFKDLNHFEMRLAAKAAAELYNHKEVDCFVCVILTHGKIDKEGSQSLFGVDGEGKKTQEIIDRFNDEKCPSLIGKPRIFFIQACRGEKADEGVMVKGEMRQLEPTDSSNFVTTRVDVFPDNDKTVEDCPSHSPSSIAASVRHRDNEAGVFPLPSVDASVMQSDNEATVFPLPSVDASVMQSDNEATVFPLPSVDASVMQSDNEATVFPLPSVDASVKQSDNEAKVFPLAVKPVLLYPHCLMMYAAPPGYVAFLDSDGSCMIQNLCKFLNGKDIGKTSLLRVLTSLMEKVAFDYESNISEDAPIEDLVLYDLKKAMLVLDTQLLKDIYMTRKN